MSLLETGRHPMTVDDVLVNKKSKAMLVFILFSTDDNLASSSVVVSPKFFHLVSHKVHPSHFTKSKDSSSVPVHFAC